jgi:hypothetical protein
LEPFGSFSVVVRVTEFMVRQNAARAFSPFNVVVRVTEFMVRQSEVLRFKNIWSALQCCKR